MILKNCTSFLFVFSLFLKLIHCELRFSERKSAMVDPVDEDFKQIIGRLPIVSKTYIFVLENDPIDFEIYIYEHKVLRLSYYAGYTIFRVMKTVYLLWYRKYGRMSCLTCVRYFVFHRSKMFMVERLDLDPSKMSN